MIILESDRLIMRNYKESDLPEYHKLLSDKKNMYYIDDIITSTLEESRLSMNEAIRLNEENKVSRFGIVLKEDKKDKLIGAVGYDIIGETPLGRIGHMGWFIMSEYQNKGYATEAVKKILEYAFMQDNCIRINTGCYVENIPTQRVMQKAGFRKEAERIQAQWHDGQMKDRFEYAINRNEYLTR